MELTMESISTHPRLPLLSFDWQASQSNLHQSVLGADAAGLRGAVVVSYSERHAGIRRCHMPVSGSKALFKHKTRGQWLGIGRTGAWWTERIRRLQLLSSSTLYEGDNHNLKGVWFICTKLLRLFWQLECGTIFFLTTLPLQVWVPTSLSLGVDRV